MYPTEEVEANEYGPGLDVNGMPLNPPDDMGMLQEGEVPVDPNAPSPEELAAEEEKARQAEEELEKELDDILRDLIKNHAEKEDIDLRYTPLNIWKRNTLYFNNIQNIFLDPIAQDYRTLNSILDELTRDGANLDIKIINVYRAYIESVVAALTVDIPAVEFTPDDAENNDDIETAKTYEKISIIVQRHNHAVLMLIKALTILCNQGTIFGRNYYDVSPAYGSYSTPIMGKKEVKTADIRCPKCGEMIDSDVPEEESKNPISCSNCGFQGPGDPYSKLSFVDEVTGYEKTPKGRSKFDIFGPTYVKAPLYARDANSIGYLILRTEDHIAKYKTKYNNDDLTDSKDSESYERWARLPLEYNNIVPQHIATLRECWFRPWYFNELAPEQADILFDKYPNGVKVCIVGDTIVEKTHKNLDEEWTISIDPRSDYLHAEPLGNSAVPIQDAENDTFNLGLQCIEYGVPETFAHPKTLNLKKYGKSNAAPGMISPALPYSPERTIADGFHTIKTATLSTEYTNFEKGLETKGQFVTGAMASIFGGTSAAGSRTADEYRQSRAQALQRLQIPFRMVKVFWSDLIYKSVIDFATGMREDEKYSEKKGGTYINIVISKSSLSGKAGQVTPDMNEQLPQSWPQKRDFITSMIEKAPDIVGPILLHPNNADLLKNYTGISELYVPGENDVYKQNAEFQMLILAAPISENESSVPIDIYVDDHEIHMSVLKDKLVSPSGLSLTPETYQNSILHYRAHELALQAKTIAQAGKTPPGVPPESAQKSAEGT
jgi:predicted RNA-binding Zn-ribbon protein involved in translation (DUF1610 family)